MFIDSSQMFLWYENYNNKFILLTSETFWWEKLELDGTQTHISHKHLNNLDH